MDSLYSYVNGNTHVTIFSDGTKHRYVNGNPQPIHPESLDVKITNYCDAGCNFCHEQSTLSGKHADLDKLSKSLVILPSGVEIAIGGGNPLSHPDLNSFLVRCKSQGLICNITVNQQHLKTYKDQILFLLKEKLVYGLGISYLSSKYHDDILPIIQATDNIVFHMIMGINKVVELYHIMSLCSSFDKKCKILLLGYKQYGFGINYYVRNSNIESNKYEWYTQLAGHFNNDNLILSFDNLAIEQMDLKRYFTDDAWNTFYMGNDFVYTMYVDAVEQKYAPSSTSSNRVDFDSVSLLDYFKNNRNLT